MVVMKPIGALMMLIWSTMRAADSLCAKLAMKLQSVIANVLTEVRALIWIVWRDIKI